MKRYRMIETFVGPLALIQNGDTLEVSFVELFDDDGRLRDGQRDDRLHPVLARKLERYFRGEKVEFDDVPIPPGPPFYRACWRACRRIPRGLTRSYGQLAADAGSPRAVRAAGQAMRNNPLTVITPCHRVVSSDNALHGYAGSTAAGCAPLNIKERLLEMEGALEVHS